MKNFDIIIRISFSGNLKKKDNSELFLNLNEKINSIYSKSFEFITCSLVLNEKFINKKIKFSDKNINKILNDFPPDKNSGRILGAFNLIDNHKYVSRDNYSSLIINDGGDYESFSSIIIQLSGKELKDEINPITFSFINYMIEFINSKGYVFNYGIAFPMDRKYQPQLFAQGIADHMLPLHYKEIADKWPNHKKDCKNKIWNIEWCNILSENHLPLNKIVSLFGLEYVKEIQKGIYACYLPFDLKDYVENNQEYHFMRQNIINQVPKEKLM